jgi:hypothetical protein
VSFTIVRPDSTTIPFEDKRLDDMAAYSTDGIVYWQIDNMESQLTKGGPFYMQFSLSDSNGAQVDHFVSEPFYWGSKR